MSESTCSRADVVSVEEERNPHPPVAAEAHLEDLDVSTGFVDAHIPEDWQLHRQWVTEEDEESFLALYDLVAPTAIRIARGLISGTPYHHSYADDVVQHTWLWAVDARESNQQIFDLRYPHIQPYRYFFNKRIGWRMIDAFRTLAQDAGVSLEDMEAEGLQAGGRTFSVYTGALSLMTDDDFSMDRVLLQLSPSEQKTMQFVLRHEPQAMARIFYGPNPTKAHMAAVYQRISRLRRSVKNILDC